jgi:hypothetical protein
VGAIFGFKRPLLQKAQIGLMNQRCTLQGMSGTLPLKVMARNVAEFFVNQGNEAL